MSWFLHDPDSEVTVVESTTCDFHKENPGKQTPFCMCSLSVGTRKATPEEYRERRRKRLTERREELRAELAGIDFELGVLADGSCEE